MNADLIAALRATAHRLERGARYRWTHMGSCNCGHLAQTLTRLPPEEIHRLALERAGDWGEQAREYCPTSGYPMDHVLAVMFDAGLTRDDVRHLERLSDPRVLRRLPAGERHLDQRRRRDVVRYLLTWADLLEDRWLERHSTDFEIGHLTKRPCFSIGWTRILESSTTNQSGQVIRIRAMDGTQIAVSCRWRPRGTSSAARRRARRLGRIFRASSSKPAKL